MASLTFETGVPAFPTVPVIAREVESLINLHVAVVVLLVAFLTAFGIHGVGGIIAVISAANAGGVTVFIAVEWRERAGVGYLIAGACLARIIWHTFIVSSAYGRCHTASFGWLAVLACITSCVDRWVRTRVVRAQVFCAVNLIRTVWWCTGLARAVARFGAVAEVTVIAFCVRDAGADEAFTFTFGGRPLIIGIFSLAFGDGPLTLTLGTFSFRHTTGVGFRFLHARGEKAPQGRAKNMLRHRFSSFKMNRFRLAFVSCYLSL
ncbi:MAG: hypothetical protein AAB579_00480 [Patescibacteria group bacterium]